MKTPEIVKLAVLTGAITFGGLVANDQFRVIPALSEAQKLAQGACREIPPGSAEFIEISARGTGSPQIETAVQKLITNSNQCAVIKDNFVQKLMKRSGYNSLELSFRKLMQLIGY